jgi:hypothetical protein
MLAEKGSELGGPWSDHLKDQSGSCGSGCAMLRRGSPTGVLLMEGSCC